MKKGPILVIAAGILTVVTYDSTFPFITNHYRDLVNISVPISDAVKAWYNSRVYCSEL